MNIRGILRPEYIADGQLLCCYSPENGRAYRVFVEGGPIIEAQADLFRALISTRDRLVPGVAMTLNQLGPVQVIAVEPTTVLFCMDTPRNIPLMLLCWALRQIFR